MPHQFLPDRPVDENQSLEHVKAGGLPIRAQRRIWEHNNSQRQVFTSTLNTSETVVARATRLSAVSQVMGSSVFHVGFKGFTSWMGGELEPLTRAHTEARQRALARMQEEARLLGAHLVLDIEFKGQGYVWAEDLIEIVAVGTAMRIDGAPPPTQMPVLALLEADQLYKLSRLGYWPVGIALGGCFWYDRHCDCWSDGNYWSSSMSGHSNAAHSARELAVERFRGFARHFKADGVVGTRIRRHSKQSEYEVNDRKHTSFAYDLMVWGTAIAKTGPGVSGADKVTPRVVVDLRDR